ncbi:MAG: nuclear transport factor 2 family protein [Planctomycetota bacterium]
MTSLSEEESTTAIHRFAVAYGQAFVDGAPDPILAMLTPDFVALTADKPPLIGLTAVRADLESDLQLMDVQDLTFTHEEVVVAGDWAYAWGRSHARVIVSGDELEIVGKYLWILHRQADGDWKLARDSASGD